MSLVHRLGWARDATGCARWPAACRVVIVACWFIFGVCPALAQGPVENLYREADSAFARGDLVQAEQKYREATRLAPRDASTYQHLGIFYLGQDKYGDAAAALEKALRLNPRLPGAQTLLGRAHYELNQVEEAITAFQAALRSDPADADALRLLGKAELQMGNYQAASDAFGKLVELTPVDAEVVQDLSSNYRRQALESLAQQGGFGPHSYEASFLSALEAEARRDYAGAVASYREALRARPDAVGTHYALGTDLARISKFDEATEEFRRELEISPNHALALWKLGVLSLRTDPEKARNYLERAVSLNPQHAPTVLAYGRALARTGQTEKAVEQFLRVVQLDPQGALAHYSLAGAYRRQGRNEDAQREMALFAELSRKTSETDQETVRAILDKERVQAGRPSGKPD